MDNLFAGWVNISVFFLSTFCRLPPPAFDLFIINICVFSDVCGSFMQAEEIPFSLDILLSIMCGLLSKMSD